MVAVQMGTYDSARFNPMINNSIINCPHSWNLNSSAHLPGSKQIDTSFHNLLSIYDMMYLMTSVYLFAIPILCQDMIGTYYVVSLPVVLPLAHIRLVGSIISTLALSLEKYLAMVHPFTRYRYLIKPVGCPT